MDLSVYETYDIIDKGELPHEPTRVVLLSDIREVLKAVQEVMQVRPSDEQLLIEDCGCRVCSSIGVVRGIGEFLKEVSDG